MSLTVQIIAQDVSSKRRIIAKLTFDSSYPAGGEALPLAQLGLSTVDLALFESGAIAATGTDQAVFAKFDYANNKVQLFEVATPAELSDTHNASDVVVRGEFIGNAR